LRKGYIAARAVRRQRGHLTAPGGSHATIADVVTTDGAQQVSALLVAWSNGDDQALKNLVPLIYPELRRIARHYMLRQAPGHTLESAALVNEAYLKLFRARGMQCEHRAHFFGLCAQVIRRILVDHARNRRYAKRGGNAVQVSLDEALLGTRPHLPASCAGRRYSNRVAKVCSSDSGTKRSSARPQTCVG